MQQSLKKCVTIITKRQSLNRTMACYYHMHSVSIATVLSCNSSMDGFSTARCGYSCHQVAKLSMLSYIVKCFSGAIVKKIIKKREGKTTLF